MDFMDLQTASQPLLSQETQTPISMSQPPNDFWPEVDPMFRIDTGFDDLQAVGGQLDQFLNATFLETEYAMFLDAQEPNAQKPGVAMSQVFPALANDVLLANPFVATPFASAPAAVAQVTEEALSSAAASLSSSFSSDAFFGEAAAAATPSSAYTRFSPYARRSGAPAATASPRRRGRGAAVAASLRPRAVAAASAAACDDQAEEDDDDNGNAVPSTPTAVYSISTQGLQILEDFDRAMLIAPTAASTSAHTLQAVEDLIVSYIREIGTKIRTEVGEKTRLGDFLSRMKGCLRNAAIGLYIVRNLVASGTNLTRDFLCVILQCVPPPSTRPSTKRVDTKLNEVQKFLRIVPQDRATVERFWIEVLLPEDRLFMRQTAPSWPGRWDRLGL